MTYCSLHRYIMWVIIFQSRGFWIYLIGEIYWRVSTVTLWYWRDTQRLKKLQIKKLPINSENNNKELTHSINKTEQLKKKSRSTNKTKKKVLLKLTKTRSIFIYSQEVVGMNWDVLFIEAAKKRACQIWASWYSGTVQKFWVQGLMIYPYRKVYIGSYLNKKFHFHWLTTINSSKGTSKMIALISSLKNQKKWFQQESHRLIFLIPSMKAVKTLHVYQCKKGKVWGTQINEHLQLYPRQLHIDYTTCNQLALTLLISFVPYLVTYKIDKLLWSWGTVTGIRSVSH